MMDAMEQTKHAQERGDILRTLQADYQAAMTSVRNLLGALDMQGVSLSDDALAFHLNYLAGQEYVQIWRGRDLPGHRKDRRGPVKSEAILFTKLLPLGLQLIDGRAPEDPLVKF